MSSIGVEMFSGRKLQRPRAALNKASHHVKRIGRQMKESSRSFIKQPRSVQYVNIGSSLEVYDVIIVGCGPSGLTAALFASRMGMSALVLGSPSSGSLAGTDALDNFPAYTVSKGGKGWLELTMDQAVDFGTQFAAPTFLATHVKKTGDEFELSLSDSLRSKVRSRAVIIASGSNPRKLNLPYESELWGRSLHNCALCDGDAYRSRPNDEKSVVVIGGGDAAVEAVSLLARIDVRTIHWIHRRDDFRANSVEVERVKSLSNVQLWTPFVVTEWITKDTNDGTKTLAGVRLVGSKDGKADPDANSSLTLPCDGAFLMIGSTPNTKWLKSSGMKIDDFGLIQTAHFTSQTSIPGIFAAGETVDGVYRQALTAASDGAKSAIDVERYLRLSSVPIVPNVRRNNIAESRREARSKDDDGDDKTEDVIVDCDLTESGCVDKIVSENPVVIFSKSFCSYCHLAKEAMESEGVTPLVFELDEIRDGREIQDTLNKMTGRRTVPNVFVGGKSIGGGSETSQLHKSGDLKRLLVKARAIT